MDICVCFHVGAVINKAAVVLSLYKFSVSGANYLISLSLSVLLRTTLSTSEVRES